MPIPEFTEYGLLPPGRFDATRHEIADRYLQNPNRAAIWEKFEQFLAELQTQSWTTSIDAYLLDGGFTSNKAATKDIDVVIDISSADDLVLYEAYFWLNSEKARLESDYQVDAYPYHPKIGNDLRDYFTYVKSTECVQKGAPLDTRKGLIVFKP